MIKDDKLIMKDNNGNIKEFDILCTYDYDDENFCIYTEYEQDENEDIKFYFAKLKDNNIIPIENELQLTIAKEVLKNIYEKIKEN
jgi:uncharacterized protein YrzB (UPF0473 family)